VTAVRQYLGDLKALVSGPRAFFDSPSPGLPAEGRLADRAADRFARLTGVSFALLFFLQEILMGGRISWIVLLVALVAFFVLPLIAVALARSAAWVVGLSSALLGENPDALVLKRASCYALAGALPAATGLAWAPWLSIFAVVILAAGMEKGLKYSPFKSGLLAAFPAALVATLLLLSAFIFKIQVF